VVELANSPALGQLRSLYVRRPEGGASAAEALARSPHAAGLRELDLSANQIGEPGACAVLRSPHLAGLHRLSLANNSLRGPATAAAVVRACRLPALTELRLGMNAFTDQGVRTIEKGFGGRLLIW
jgi:hypothetical protein